VKFFPFRGRRSPDHTYELGAPPARRITYEVRSAPGGTIPVSGTVDRDFYLRLPPEVSNRVRNLAKAIHATARNDSGRIEALSDWFRSNNFTYSRSGLPTGRDSLEKFLFEQRTGHCEFFASSFAIILRAAGVPARLVGGYLGGEYNELGGYYLVTEDLAHVWVEAFVAGEGWRRIDPSSMARNADTFWGKNRPRSPALKLKLAMDSLNHYWNRSVINYDFERQVEIVRNANLRLKGVDAGRIWQKLLPAGIAIALAVVIYLLIRGRGFRMSSREERLLRSFIARFQRDRGERIDPSREGLIAIARRTGDQRVRQFVAIYARAVYRDTPLTPDEHKRLKGLIRQGFR
jgi:hypothetical protein